jgi:hypothetical protein
VGFVNKNNGYWGFIMKKDQELLKKVAQLESRVDFLETEFTHLNLMLIRVGFDDGIKTLAQALHESIEIEKLVKPRRPAQ